MPSSQTAPTPVSATIVLREPDPKATEALAAATGMSHTERMTRLSATLPLAVTKSSALAAVSALGLTVDTTTPWSVVVHGPASAVARLTASGSRSGLVTSSPALVPAVSTVVSGGPTGILHPRAFRALTGADFRTAYGASSAAPTGPNAPVIATLQFAGWDPTDLTTYAAANGLPAPGPGSFTPISIDGANPTAVDPDNSVEVALDQESIYSVDPYLAQRAYFAPNNGSGFSTPSRPSPPTPIRPPASWRCRSPGAAVSPRTRRPTCRQCTQRWPSLAAGVTVFAASGDDGSADCAFDALQSNSNNVDYPASDPMVVGVGGTDLDTVGPLETAWGNTDNGAFDGSGGGVSTIWPRPDYQAAVAPSATFREVPDIAADADRSAFIGDLPRRRRLRSTAPALRRRSRRRC